MSYQQLAPSTGQEHPNNKPSVATTAPTPEVGGIAVVVLPFANLSSDKDQEFFSDGMTDEIASALAKVPNLRVVGRSSAFQFKGQSRDIQAVGQRRRARLAGHRGMGIS